jgi:RNA polymerase sigma factor (sigma-70 family)
VWDASDEALLAGYATGEPDAAAVFVHRFQRRVVGLALAITRDRAEAEEVAQDAFVRAWRHAAGYDPRRGRVSSWLLGITRNAALDRLRVSSRRRELPVDDFADELLGHATSDLADRAGDRDAVERVIASMDSLPPEQREAVLAVTIYGLTAAELSAATGVPLGTAKTRIRLGLVKLREAQGASVR